MRGRLDVPSASESIEHLYRLGSREERKKRNSKLVAECRNGQVAAKISWGWGENGSEIRFDGHLLPRSTGCDLVGRVATPLWHAVLLVAVCPALMWWEDFEIADIIGGTALAAAVSLVVVHVASHGPRKSLVDTLRRAINTPVPRADD